MAEPAFDTLTIARELEHDYGFDAKQAEGAAVMIHRHLVGNVATKEDLKAQSRELTGQIKALDEKLTGKITALDDRIGVELKWIKLIGGAILAVLVMPWLKELATVFLS